jgi:hypothetical protein
MDAKQTGPTIRKWKAIALAVATAVLGGAAGWGGGYFQGWLATTEAEAARDDALQSLAELEARRRISLALEAVDADNAGLAGEELAAAARVLTEAPEADSDEISTLVGHLEAIEPSAEQRATIQRLARRLDELQSDAAARP